MLTRGNDVSQTELFSSLMGQAYKQWAFGGSPLALKLAFDMFTEGLNSEETCEIGKSFLPQLNARLWESLRIENRLEVIRVLSAAKFIIIGLSQKRVRYAQIVKLAQTFNFFNTHGYEVKAALEGLWSAIALLEKDKSKLALFKIHTAGCGFKVPFNQALVKFSTEREIRLGGNVFFYHLINNNLMRIVNLAELLKGKFPDFFAVLLAATKDDLSEFFSEFKDIPNVYFPMIRNNIAKEEVVKWPTYLAAISSYIAAHSYIEPALSEGLENELANKFKVIKANQFMGENQTLAKLLEWFKSRVREDYTGILKNAVWKQLSCSSLSPALAKTVAKDQEKVRQAYVRGAVIGLFSSTAAVSMIIKKPIDGLSQGDNIKTEFADSSEQQPVEGKPQEIEQEQSIDLPFEVSSQIASFLDFRTAKQISRVKWASYALAKKEEDRAIDLAVTSLLRPV